jgi:hypothetical protein
MFLFLCISLKVLWIFVVAITVTKNWWLRTPSVHSPAVLEIRFCPGQSQGHSGFFYPYYSQPLEALHSSALVLSSAFKASSAASPDSSPPVTPASGVTSPLCLPPTLPPLALPWPLWIHPSDLGQCSHPTFHGLSPL